MNAGGEESGLGEPQLGEDGHAKTAPDTGAGGSDR